MNYGVGRGVHKIGGNQENRRIWNTQARGGGEGGGKVCYSEKLILRYNLALYNLNTKSVLNTKMV